MESQTPPFGLITDRQWAKFRQIIADIDRKEPIGKRRFQRMLGHKDLRSSLVALINNLAPAGPESQIPRTRLQLLEACLKAGIKVGQDNDPVKADCEGGEDLPLLGEPPKLLFDLEKTFQREEEGKRPFGLSYNQQMTMGGGLCSVEETLAALLAYHQEYGSLPSQQGSLNCRNRYGSDCSLNLFWVLPEVGIRIGFVLRDSRCSFAGGLLRQNWKRRLWWLSFRYFV